jgi:hypothetical protein
LYLAENVEDNSNGIVFNFMVTMEDKHKSKTATYRTKISMHVIVPSNIRSVTIYDDGNKCQQPHTKELPTKESGAVHCTYKIKILMEMIVEKFPL